MSISVKAFLVRSKGSEEIRRFNIDGSVGANFVYFSNKIQNVFPELLNKQFTVSWKGWYFQIQFQISIQESRLKLKCLKILIRNFVSAHLERNSKVQVQRNG